MRHLQEIELVPTILQSCSFTFYKSYTCPLIQTFCASPNSFHLRDFLLREFRVLIVCICHVIPRGPSCRRGGASFNTKVKTLHEVLATLVESIQGFFCWFHKRAHEPCQDSSFTGWRSLKYFGPISPLS